MTTTDTVQQPPAAREVYAAAWKAIHSLIGDGLPLPHAVTAYSDGGFTIAFDHLADGRVWAGALGLELKNGTERHATDLGRGAMTHYAGQHRGAAIALFVHEPADLIDVPMVADVEAYVGEPKLPAASSDYFREDLETGAPLPRGVEGHHLGSRFTCLAEGGE